jgi:DNA-binding GntR family transcriptional regulator
VQSQAQHYHIGRGALADRICEVLKRDILSGRLVPGQRLSLEEFAQYFQVSITPVRDALRLLAADGLVELIPRRGAFVTQPVWEDLKEIYHIREILECAAVPAIQRKGAPVLRKLRDLLEQMAMTNMGESHRDYLSYIRLDQRFHQSLVDCLDNRRLSQIYASLGSHTLVTRALYSASNQRASETLAEHRAILAALEKGQEEEARAAIHTHLQNGQTEIRRQISANPAAANSSSRARAPVAMTLSAADSPAESLISGEE